MGQACFWSQYPIWGVHPWTTTARALLLSARASPDHVAAAAFPELPPRRCLWHPAADQSPEERKRERAKLRERREGGLPPPSMVPASAWRCHALRRHRPPCCRSPEEREVEQERERERERERDPPPPLFKFSHYSLSPTPIPHKCILSYFHFSPFFSFFNSLQLNKI